MPTEPKALVDLLLYLEKNFSVLPPEIACGANRKRDQRRLAAAHARRLRR
jgi:hypothetical protein